MSEKTGYKPTSGMQSAARRALKLKEEGKANGAGTSVGWTRARQLANGEALSLSTVKRMFSFFSRHEVDKKGKDWDNAENPSNGKIMWLAWGGDAGFSWSRKIVEREKNMKKSEDINEIVEEIKDMFDDALNPITKIEEIDEIQKSGKDMTDQGCDCATCKEKGISCDQCDKCMTMKYVSEDEHLDKWNNIEKACWQGYKQVGMKDKNGKQVPNCVPINKSTGEPEAIPTWSGAFGGKQ